MVGHNLPVFAEENSMSTNNAALRNSLSLNSLVTVAQDQVSSDLAGEIIK
jgi:hypothetical protein